MGTRTIEKLIERFAEHGDKLRPAQRAILMALAHRHNDVGRICNPSIAGIRAITGQEDAHIRRCLKEMPGDFLRKERQPGKPSTFYFDWYLTQAQEAGREQTPVPETGVGGDSGGVSQPGVGCLTARGGVSHSPGTPVPETSEKKEKKLKEVKSDAGVILRVWDLVIPQLSNAGAARLQDPVGQQAVINMGGWKHLGRLPQRALESAKWQFVDAYRMARDNPESKSA